MRRMFKHFVFAVMAPLFISSCARVQSTGNRTDGGAEVRVKKLYQYSFLTMNPMAMKRLDRDLSLFNKQLADELRSHHFDVTAEEAQASALRNNLPINVIQNDNYSGGPFNTHRSGSKIIPVNQIIAANRSTEEQLMVSHRLILFPAMTSFHGDVGSVTSDVNWRLQSVKDDKVIAEGSMHYIADIRGFPGKEMAEQLISKLESLNIR